LEVEVCKIEDCGRKKKFSNGLCALHYRRLWKTGITDDPPKKAPRVHRYRTEAGYEFTPLGSPFRLKHREVLFAKIGPGEHPCHHCGDIVSWDKTYPKDLDGLVTDHLDSKRDNNDPCNLVPSCNKCNARRGQAARTLALRERHARIRESRLRIGWKLPPLVRENTVAA
jgi:hypothetical protein